MKSSFHPRNVGFTVWLLSLVILIGCVCGIEFQRCREVQFVTSAVEGIGGNTTVEGVFGKATVNGCTSFWGVWLVELHVIDCERVRNLAAANDGAVGIDAPKLSRELLCRASRLGSIRVLDLEGTFIGNAGFAEFANYCPLEVVGLSGTQCDNDAIRALSNCRGVTQLRCAGLTIDDDCVINLLKLPSLSHLDVSNTNLSRQGVRLLCGIRTLKSIRTMGNNVTESEVVALRKEFPHLVINANE